MVKRAFSRPPGGTVMRSTLANGIVAVALACATGCNAQEDQTPPGAAPPGTRPVPGAAAPGGEADPVPGQTAPEAAYPGSVGPGPAPIDTVMPAPRL